MQNKLNIEEPSSLIQYLQQSGRITPDETPVITPLSGGVSNSTLLVERPGGEAWVVKQALEKLRVETEWHCSPQRVHHEALGIRWLSQLAPAGSIVPFLFEDHEHHLLAMQAVPQPHENWKTLLLKGQLGIHHAEQFARFIGAVHLQSHKRRDEIQPVFADRTYFDLLRLDPYYCYTAEQLPEARVFLLALIDESRAMQTALTHGDFSPKNVLVHNDQLIVLDHEVIHFGDSAFDIGFSLTHLLAKSLHVKSQRQAFLTAALRYWNVYSETAGEMFDPAYETRAVHHALACLLARVAGKSPLEYLTEPERKIQVKTALALIAEPVHHVPQCIRMFGEYITRYE